jgi:hypothetical protein
MMDAMGGQAMSVAQVLREWQESLEMKDGKGSKG